MKKVFHFFFLINLSSVSLLVVLFTALFISENYFFDKLIYKKSMLHGYYAPYSSSEKFFNSSNPFLKDPRHRDIGAIFSSSNNRVLGVTSEVEDNYQIAILGDSMPYGLGVRTSQSYPVFLENYLNSLKIKDIDFDILNYSMGGDDILDHYIKYLAAERKGSVDLYVLAILSNDFFIKRDDKYPGKNEAYDELVGKCGGVPIKEPLGYGEDGYAELFNQALLEASNSEVNNCFFNFILGRMRDEEIVAFAIEDIIPYEDVGQEKYVNYVYAKHLLDYGIKLWSFPASRYFKIDYEKVVLSSIEGHPNPIAHRAYAYYLSLFILNEKLGDQMNNDEFRKKVLEETGQLLLQESAKLK